MVEENGGSKDDVWQPVTIAKREGCRMKIKGVIDGGSIARKKKNKP